MCFLTRESYIPSTMRNRNWRNRMPYVVKEIMWCTTYCLNWARTVLWWVPSGNRRHYPDATFRGPEARWGHP